MKDRLQPNLFDRSPQTRRCTTCRQYLPLDQFHKGTKKLGGHAYNCKKCACVYTRQNYQLNAEQRRAEAQARRARLSAQGICNKCGNRPAAENRKKCPECLAIYTTPAAKQKKVEWFRQRKDQIYARYGGYVCACCGETEPVMLNLDHIHNDGKQHRMSLNKDPKARSIPTDKLYNWIIHNNFPPIFQVLCYNCNIGKYRNKGTCPHSKN